eukprot:CAMPEP_0114566058 /NCGR_PEP_ID=MMETSP0114-20121206/14673_1 /TAXON_ID=31324 /ORGANISM="Goniomonas sp, Strain m" /LENGTH=94 /DNA_ID=CAMNT_0001752411 /DNA_START=1122 /DNA_END=1407 /DNA_ORIENTATION=-
MAKRATDTLERSHHLTLHALHDAESPTRKRHGHHTNAQNQNQEQTNARLKCHKQDYEEVESSKYNQSQTSRLPMLSKPIREEGSLKGLPPRELK